MSRRGWWLGLALGLALAACGSARKPAAAPGAEPAAMSSPTPLREIEELDRGITEELAKLGIARPPLAATACLQPPCSAEALSTAPGAGAAAQCTRSTRDTCTEACTIGDAICTSAGRICTLARDLGGADGYANEKCASGKASCDAAQTRCCGCS